MHVILSDHDVALAKKKWNAITTISVILKVLGKSVGG